LSARLNAGPFRTLSLGYRFVRQSSEQIDVGWQWPIYGAGSWMDQAPEGKPQGTRLSNLASNRECRGTLYSVGRVNYSYRDSRVTDSLVGLEYDAGCWIGRFVVERLSTGLAEATQRYLFQLELVGLSRLGSNPLRVLKDNISGYRLLREDAPPLPAPPVYE
jgi:LPS-assembly protein